MTKVTNGAERVRFVTAMARWTAQTTITALPSDVLMLLTEPDSISRWAPIPFDILDWDGDRLMAGEHVRVKGHLAGRSLEFEVDVTEADEDHLVLTATGPIRIDVEYSAYAVADDDAHVDGVQTGQGFAYLEGVEEIVVGEPAVIADQVFAQICEHAAAETDRARGQEYLEEFTELWPARRGRARFFCRPAITHER